MSTTVSVPGRFEVTSNTDSPESMIASLTKPTRDEKPRITAKNGEPVKDDAESDPEKEGLSKAASEMGKEGGKAAAAKRAEAAKAKAAEDKKAAKGEADKAEEPDEPEPDSEAAKVAAEKKAARHDSQARIAELAKERRDAEARAERAERELAQERRTRTATPPSEERRQAQPERTAEVAPAADEPAEPRMEEFADIGSYTKALADHQWNKRERQVQEQQATRQRHEAIQSHVTSFVERLAGGVKVTDPEHAAKLAEFREGVAPELLELTPSFMVPPEQKQPIHQLADEIMVSPHSREVLQYLTENPEEFQRIAALRTIRDVSRAMAIVERDAQEAATAGASTEREPSKAKPPARPVAGSPHATEPDIHGDLSFDEFLARKHGTRKR